MKWAGCNYWIGQGKHPQEPIGTATSMHFCNDCEHASECPLQKETQVWPYGEEHEKLSTEVTDAWKKQKKASASQA